MLLAGRIISVESYSTTAPVEEQTMLFLSLVLTEQVRFHQLNFSTGDFFYLQFAFYGTSD